MQPDKSGKLILREKNIADGLHLVLKNYPAGLRMERHAHEEWRYCLALRGSYTDSWQRNYRTRTPGQLSLHPPSEMHTSVFHTPAACFHIGFTRDWRKRLLDEAGIAQEPLEFLSGRAPSLASQLYQEFRRSDGCSPLVLEGLACELAGWSARSQRGEPAGPSWAYEARDLLHDRFHESLNLKEIAATFGVHSVHLARQFKRTFGWTVGDYVRRLRVEFVCNNWRRASRWLNSPSGRGFRIRAISPGSSNDSRGRLRESIGQSASPVLIAP